jgi:hypothetical protein
MQPQCDLRLVGVLATEPSRCTSQLVFSEMNIQLLPAAIRKWPRTAGELQSCSATARPIRLCRRALLSDINVDGHRMQPPLSGLAINDGKGTGRQKELYRRRDRADSL